MELLPAMSVLALDDLLRHCWVSIHSPIVQTNCWQCWQLMSSYLYQPARLRCCCNVADILLTETIIKINKEPVYKCPRHEYFWFALPSSVQRLTFVPWHPACRPAWPMSQLIQSAPGVVTFKIKNNSVLNLSNARWKVVLVYGNVSDNKVSIPSQFQSCCAWN